MANVTTASEQDQARVIVRVDRDLHEQMQAAAKAEDRTMASLIRAALRRYVTAAR